MAQLDAVERLIGQLGAARFEPLRLNCRAKTLRAMGSPGRGAAAAAALGRGQPRRPRSLSAARRRLGALALTTDDPDERRRAVDEGERLLARGLGRPQPLQVLSRHDRRRPARGGIGTRPSGWPRRWTASPLPSRCLGRISMSPADGRSPPGVAGERRSDTLRSSLRALRTRPRGAGLLLALPSIERRFRA